MGARSVVWNMRGGMGLFMGGLARFVRHLMLACMGCFAGVMGSDDLARLANLEN